jgi:hypothetical protein
MSGLRISDVYHGRLVVVSVGPSSSLKPSPTWFIESPWSRTLCAVGTEGTCFMDAPEG